MRLNIEVVRDIIRIASAYNIIFKLPAGELMPVISGFPCLAMANGSGVSRKNRGDKSQPCLVLLLILSEDKRCLLQ